MVGNFDECFLYLKADFPTFVTQHRMKSAQREKAREFANLTQTGEKTAQYCLQHHDWKLDLALDSYFANPEFYCKEPKASVDRKKLETLFSRYKGKNHYSSGIQNEQNFNRFNLT